MGALTRTLSVAVAAALVAASAHAADAQRSAGAKLYGDAARGGAIAARWCVSCHVVEGPSLSDQAPAFAALAASARTDGAIRAFLMQPHAPMPPLALSNQEIEDLVAYVGLLRSGKTSP